MIKTYNPLFHLAIPVDILENAEAFYAGVLGCAVGRRSDEWIDFNFYGHQLTVHLTQGNGANDPTNTVDGKAVPVRHYGIVLDTASWRALSKKIAGAGVEFLIAPCVRFAGKIGEQGTFFILDPAGNALEFKYFNDPDQLFATEGG